HRERTSSLITLFTFNRKAWKMPPLEAIRKYGSLDKDGRMGLYYTLSSRPNSAGLFVDISPEQLTVRHVSGNIIAIWALENLARRFSQKIPALIFLRIASRGGIFHALRLNVNNVIRLLVLSL
ncbi:MAG: hypothetical protein SH821_08835, partial [Phototrophicales bacterium]|nr:hypothetical protein [Phototrophicales bacterium]